MELTGDYPASLRLPLEFPKKILMGPGPCNCPPRVLHALSLPVLSPLHAECYQLLHELKDTLKYFFQTKNELTLVLSASGNGGTEASLCNLIEPGDVVLIGVNGMWSDRAAEFAGRYGAKVIRLEKALGECFKLDEVEKAIIKHKPILFFVTLGESSTGVQQPMEGLGELCHKNNCLLIVDAVVALATVPVFTDLWGVDVIFTCSQKGLSCPPGLAPISFSPRAVDRMKSRKVPPAVFYWDVLILGKYWGCFGKDQPYHHTIPVNLLYGLREALAIITEEGLENVWARHRVCSERLKDGLQKLGVNFFVKDEKIRLAPVTTICSPNINWKLVIDYAIKHYNLDLAEGAGPTAGMVLCIGVLGYNARPDRVDLVLKVLKEALEYARGIQSTVKK